MLEEKLKHYNSIKRLIGKIEIEKQNIETRATKITPVYTETTSRSNTISDKVGDNAVLLAELDKKINVYKAQMQMDLIEILDGIMAIEYPYKEILFSWYCEDKTIEAIADEMGYSPSRIKQLKAEAMERIRTLY